MRTFIIFFLLLFIVGCNNEETTKQIEDKILTSESSPVKADYIPDEVEKSEVLMNPPHTYYTDMWEASEDSNQAAGAACAVMAVKFFDKDTSFSIDIAKELRTDENGYWNLSDIKSVIFPRGVKGEEEIYLSPDDIISALKSGYPVIAPIDTTYIEYTPKSKDKSGRYYFWGSGHFVFINGLTRKDDKLFYQENDPYSMGHLNPDGTPIGENRLYSIGDMDLAIKKWWSVILILKPYDSMKDSED